MILITQKEFAAVVFIIEKNSLNLQAKYNSESNTKHH